MLLVCSAKTPLGSFVSYCFCIGLRLLPYTRSGGEHSGRELHALYYNSKHVIGPFNLALKIQFREIPVFSFPVSSICRFPSLGIRYASYFHLIQVADSCSVVITTPYIPTKVILFSSSFFEANSNG